MQPATRSSTQPAGATSGDWGHRLLRHQVPLALASAVVLVVFMTLPPFDPQAYPQVRMDGGVIPQQVEPMDHGEGQTGPAEDQMPQRQDEGQRHSGRQTGPSEDEIPQQEGEVQRLNYALFALVIAHAIFYGALLRVTSPYTLLLGLIVIAVFAGQAMGIWAWRRRRISGRQAFGRHP